MLPFSRGHVQNLSYERILCFTRVRLQRALAVPTGWSLRLLDCSATLSPSSLSERCLKRCLRPSLFVFGSGLRFESWPRSMTVKSEFEVSCSGFGSYLNTFQTCVSCTSPVSVAQRALAGPGHLTQMQDGHAAIQIVRRFVTVPPALTVCLSMATSFPARGTAPPLLRPFRNGICAKFVDSEEMWSWAFRTNSVPDWRRVASERCAGAAPEHHELYNAFLGSSTPIKSCSTPKEHEVETPDSGLLDERPQTSTRKVRRGHKGPLVAAGRRLHAAQQCKVHCLGP